MTDTLVRVVSICATVGLLRVRDQMFYEQRLKEIDRAVLARRVLEHVV